MKQTIEHLKSQKAEIARQKMELDKRDADIDASLAALTGESIPPQGKVGKNKRPQTESVDVEMEQRLTDAEESNLLPEGLVKKNGTKVACNRQPCGDCEYIPKPFHHFAMNNQSKKCTCHICQLYESEDRFPTLAKIYVKKMKKRSKKTRR